MERGVSKAFILAAIMLLPAFAGSALVAISDPVDTPDSIGTRSLLWNFNDPGDYFSENTTISSGCANISLYNSIWHQTSNADFGNGTSSNNIVVSAGEVRLILDTGLELIQNGNFTSGSGSTASNWSAETSGNVLGFNEGRYTPGGLWDNTYCWRNWFAEGHPVQGYNRHVWVNQTFNLTSIPVSVNMGAFHRFVNNSFDINPGTFAAIYVKNLGSNKTFNVTSRNWTYQTDANYTQMVSGNASIFDQAGLYNFTLYTYTSSEGDGTQQPTDIENFWDNASLQYSAYRPKGNFTSQVFDTGSYSIWSNVSWRESLSPGTDISIFVRTGNSTVPTDSIWSPWSLALTEPAGSAIDRPSGRFIQYRVELETAMTNVTPVLENVTIHYRKFHLQGRVGTFDQMPSNITSWGFFSHNEDLVGQNVRYEYSTDSGSTWNQMPLDGDLRSVLPSLPIRIRAILTTADTVVTPSITSMELTYVSTEPSITLETLWDQSSVGPGETVRLYVHFNNTADSISETAWLNIYLSEEMQYLANNSASLPIFNEYINDDNPNVQKYVFTSIPTGSNMIWLDVMMGMGIDDGTMLQSTVTLEYLDPIGNRIESKLQQVSIRADAPVIEATLSSLESSADVGETIHCTVRLNNTGHGNSPNIWINATIDDRLAGPGTQSLNLTIRDLAPLSEELASFTLSMGTNVVQDSSIPLLLDVQYSDESGHVRDARTNLVSIMARLRSDMSISLETQSSQVNSSTLFIVTVYYNNQGYGSAESIYFNMTLPDGLLVDESSEDYINFGNYYIWEVENVGPGEHSFTISFFTKNLDIDISRNVIQMYMQVTDPVEGEQDTVASNALPIDIIRIYTIWERIYWPWSGLAMLVVGIFAAYGLWYYFKPEPPTIDDAFVIYRDGRLISHRKSKSGLRAELDGDLVSAMLTAVQEFISDSLSKDRSDKVKKLEFGDRELFVERGQFVNLAVIYSGSMNKKLESQIIELTKRIEEEHPFLPLWDGRMTKLDDINPILDDLIGQWQHNNGNSISTGEESSLA